ncbi:hypothetical protein ICW40_05200 [Actinotalea ferrariae]|uniref:hypothetical protein n=1 Tax=Actinotalea ferrariae TaxID=1386098 RepID=UPI001C8CD284|nr:hypothetical protein [Actinotalea ferrariae]MBX9244202.1 hypothetical protein [Actinotalea ferrariae]
MVATSPPAATRSEQAAPRDAGVLREGASVLRDTGRLLAAHWPALVLLAVLVVLSRELLLDVAVVVSRSSGVVSTLVMAVVPFCQLLAVVGMLLVLRGRHAPTAATPDEAAPLDPAHPPSRRARLARGVSALVVATAAVLVPFLLVYEHDGQLGQDLLAHGFALATDTIALEGDIDERLTDGTSVVVVATVAVALAARRLLTLLIRRTPAAREGRRALLRLAAGYCEAVWVVLGFYVVADTLGSFAGWWSSRAAGVAVAEWWEGVAGTLPHLAAWVAVALAGLGLLVNAAVTGLVIPLAWLNLAAVVYGVEATKVLHARDLAARRRLGAVVSRVGDERTDRALALLTDPERRFGAVIGAAGLIARAGWRPVLVVCLVFLVTDNVGLLLWEAARVVVGPESLNAWVALAPWLDTVGTVASRVLTLALVAAAANAILVGLGLPDALRLHGRRPPPGPGAVPAEPASAAVDRAEATTT